YGAPVADDSWQLVLEVDGVFAKHAHVVVGTPALDTWADIAAALAADINANAAADFSASVEGNTLIIVHRADAVFGMANLRVVNRETATTLVQLSGTPVTGEVWTAM